jgi:hypothetical protein
MFQGKLAVMTDGGSGIGHEPPVSWRRPDALG